MTLSAWRQRQAAWRLINRLKAAKAAAAWRHQRSDDGAGGRRHLEPARSAAHLSGGNNVALCRLMKAKRRNREEEEA